MKPSQMTEHGRRRAEPYEWIRCANCRLEIESCDGRYGDWMHTDSRRELCADGRVASPETAEQMTRRHKGTCCA